MTLSASPGPDGDRLTLFDKVATTIVFGLNGLLSLVGMDARGHGLAFVLGGVFGGLTVIFVIVLVVYGVARAFGKARSTAAAVRLSMYTALILLVLKLGHLVASPPTTGARAQDPPVTPAERANLQVTPDSAWHDDLGFMIPWPRGGFAASPEFQRQLDEGLAGQPAVAAWIFRDSTAGQAIVIQVTKMARLDEASFRGYARGVRDAMSKGELVDEALSWSAPGGEYRLVVRHPTGVYMAWRCLPRIHPPQSAVVCVNTTTARLEDLADVRAGLIVRE